MNLDNVRRDDWIVGGLAILLLIALVAFPWFSIGGGSIGGVSIPSFDFTATDAPDGWLGLLAVIALIAAVADLAVERLSPQTQLPEIGGSRTMTRFVLVAAAAGFMALKFLFHLGHFSDLGWGFWLSVVVVGALLYFAEQARAGDTGVSSRPTSTPPSPTPPTSTPPAGSSEPPPSSPPPGS